MGHTLRSRPPRSPGPMLADRVLKGLEEENSGGWQEGGLKLDTANVSGPWTGGVCDDKLMSSFGLVSTLPTSRSLCE